MMSMAAKGRCARSTALLSPSVSKGIFKLKCTRKPRWETFSLHLIATSTNDSTSMEITELFPPQEQGVKRLGLYCLADENSRLTAETFRGAHYGIHDYGAIQVSDAVSPLLGMINRLDEVAREESIGPRVGGKGMRLCCGYRSFLLHINFRPGSHMINMLCIFVP